MCAHCGWVDKLCFWGHRAPASWKRPALVLVSSLGVMITCMPFVSYLLGENDYFGMAFAVLTLGTLSGLGLLIGAHACDACVARLLGKI